MILPRRVAAGYNIVDLNQEPFKIYKQAQPQIDLNEGDIAVNDFSNMSYADAFEALFKQVSVQYPFTPEKKINWNTPRSVCAPDCERQEQR